MNAVMKFKISINTAGGILRLLKPLHFLKHPVAQQEHFSFSYTKDFFNCDTLASGDHQCLPVKDLYNPSHKQQGL